MLVRLRPRALARVDHEQEEVDPGRARDHRAHEALVAGHVDEGELRAVGQLERGVAERDRDPALALLRQPVGVLAGERADEPGLAVVDVPGGADGQRHLTRSEHGGGDLVGLGVRQRAAVQQQSAVADDADDRRLTVSERLGERLLDRAGEARQLGQRKRAAADAADRLLDLAADRSGQPLRRGREPPRAARSASAAPAPRAARARARGRARASPRARASVSLSARSARWSGWRRSRSTSSARPTTIPACGPPSSLSPEKQTRSEPAARLSRAEGSPSRWTRTPEPRSSTSGSPCRRGDRRQLGHRRLLGEADDAEVRLVHAQQHRGLGPDRALVVGGARAVGRADLAQARARAREHVRDPEAVADLDQLAARDEHLPILGQRREREHHRRRVVVHDQRRLGAGQPPQDAGDVILPRATAAGLQVVLEVRVAAPDLERPLERGLGQRRPSEVRVHDHSRGIQRAPQRGRPGRRQLAQRPLDEIARVMPGL